jgi:hypothetical protein
VRPGAFIIFSILLSVPISAQNRDSYLKELYDGHHWFALRKEASGPDTPPFYKAAVQTALNDPLAEKSFTTLISSTGGAEERFEARELLIGIYFTLDWLQDPELRRRSHVGLNKGEQQNALRRAVFFNRLGEIRDRSYENQRHRASGLNLLVASIILWNTVYLQRAVDYLGKQGHHPEPTDLAHLSPLGWEHINLTGDYHWESSTTLGPDQFRPLRTRSHDPAMAA